MPLLLLVGFLLPGGAQLLQGRKAHALLLGGLVVVTFLIGMLISGFTAIDPANHEVYLMMQSLVPLLTWGMDGAGLVKEPLLGVSVTELAQRIGICFTSVAGLCNLLAVFEALRHDPALLLAAVDAEEEAVA